jgi:hypothetical protein
MEKDQREDGKGKQPLGSPAFNFFIKTPHRIQNKTRSRTDSGKKGSAGIACRHFHRRCDLLYHTSQHIAHSSAIAWSQL